MGRRVVAAVGAMARCSPSTTTARVLRTCIVSQPILQPRDGANPDGGLVLSGNTLYGTTHSGGTYYGGTVFAVPTYGTDFTNLHNFTGTNDGANPYAGLMVSGSTLFGTAGNGGKGFDGTLFAVNTNGTGFTTVHTFTAWFRERTATELLRTPV